MPLYLLASNFPPLGIDSAFQGSLGRIYLAILWLLFAILIALAAGEIYRIPYFDAVVFESARKSVLA